MDGFAILAAGSLGALIVALLLIGRFYPGTGAEVLDWKPTRSPELEAELELDDTAQMLEAANERRRRRGQPERTLADVELQVAADLRESHRRFAEQKARQDGDEADLERELALSNERRARRGLPPRTAEQLRAELGDTP